MIGGFSTVTQKGQVAIPKSIRDELGIKPSDRLQFSVEDNKVVAHRVPSVEEMRGFIKTNKVLTKKQYKRVIEEAILERFRRKNS